MLDAERLATEALRWLIDSDDDDEADPSLYSGTAGIVITLLEAHRHFGDEAYADAAVRAARGLATAVDGWDHASLYFGLTGIAFALHAADEPGVAARALALVRDRFDGERWSEQFELLGGNAGIALGALAMGDLDLATLAVTPYLRTAEPTPGGVHWEVKAGAAPRLHHISHGTLGIVSALAAVGAATGRDDLVDLALAGAADVVGRDEAGPDGFLVPHSDPQQQHELLERYSHGWCHGPAGDAQAFRQLAAVTGDLRWPALVERCWLTVVSSGLPQRLRPGFWDNSGRCCGTAGVLALACDRYAEGGGDLDFATVLVDDLRARATVDDAGARWCNEEHRVTPSTLPPQRGWAMGNAGIVRELLRFARLSEGRDGGYAVDWPDHPPVTRRAR